MDNDSYAQVVDDATEQQRQRASEPTVTPEAQAVVDALLETNHYGAAGRYLQRLSTEEQRAAALEGAMALAQALYQMAARREDAQATGAIDENGSDGVDHSESDHWQEVRIALNSGQTRQRLAELA